MKTTFLEFEQPIAELETKIEELRFVQDDSALDISEEISRLQKKSQQLTKEIYSKLTAWQISQVARHPQRPYALDYIQGIFTGFEELHGDRAFADDAAIVGGLARFNGQPVVDAEVDVWQSSSEGFYENQDPQQVDMNLRGKFRTDAQGRVRFRTIKPSGYPIPVDGPAGDLIKTLGRHNMRPAHIHFMICKPGFKTQFSQVYSSDDPNLSTDVQFGVTDRLIGHYQRQDSNAPDADIQGVWYTLDYQFVLEPGQNSLPKPPITAKAEGDRPQLKVLTRR